MAREKAPAFQFYTKDWDSDINVIPMTYEEEGVYFALIRLLWNHPKLSANLDELRLLLKGKPRLSLMQKWWTKIGKCFTVRDGVLVHKRVERERKKQAAYRKTQRNNGLLGGRPKSQPKPTDNPSLSSGKPLLSASATSVSTEPPTPLKGGRRKTRAHLRAVAASHHDPSAVSQAEETSRRRQQMAAAGMSPEEIEQVFEREYDERRAARA